MNIFDVQLFVLTLRTGNAVR